MASLRIDRVFPLDIGVSLVGAYYVYEKME